MDLKKTGAFIAQRRRERHWSGHGSISAFVAPLFFAFPIWNRFSPEF